MASWLPSSWGGKRRESEQEDSEAEDMDPRVLFGDEGDGDTLFQEASSSSLLKLDRTKEDPEVAISPKSIRILEEAEIRAHHRSRRRNIVSFDIDAKNSTYRDGDQLMTNWISQIGIDNQNFYPISIREVTLTAFLDHDRSVPIGVGRGKDLYFPSRSHVINGVNFQMPVFAPSTGKPSLIAECMANERVDLFITAEIDLSWTHWTGHWVPAEFYATVDCRIPAVAQVLRLA